MLRLRARLCHSLLIAFVATLGILSFGPQGVHWHLDTDGHSHRHSHGGDETQTFVGVASGFACSTKRRGTDFRERRLPSATRRAEFKEVRAEKYSASHRAFLESLHLEHLATIVLTI
jgi:hypothetical protein